MDLPEAIDLCLSLPGAEETTPFGPDVLVYKVGGKVFALTDPGDFPTRMNL
ncbi:MAG: MmcQ/YjbR family DNA-binding protein, partial [Verrucomicrobiaceae bacterium]